MHEMVKNKIPVNKDFSYSRAYQSSGVSAKYKQRPEDFIVEEKISLTLSGEGEHCWLYIKKRGCNTEWVAQQLAKYCAVSKQAVSYAGLKDRHAVTSQWFSVQLPGMPTPDWDAFEAAMTKDDTGENIQVIESCRHNKKLQRGALKSNAFTIILRGLIDQTALNDNDDIFRRLSQQCELIAKKGVPNYFGPQRFGRDLNNLDRATRMLSNSRSRLSRQKSGLYLSAARSWLFNTILSERVDLDIWDKRLPGDVFMLDGKSACFRDEADDIEQINARLSRNEVHPTAVMWGEGEPMVAAQTEKMESRIIDQFPVYRDGLKSARVKSQRRACRVVPDHFKYSQMADDFTVSFSLPAGSYATVVLAEIFSQLSTMG